MVGASAKYLTEGLKILSLHSKARAYPSFCGMKQLGVFQLPPGWDASQSQGYPQHLTRQYPFIHQGGDRHYECLAQEHNTMSPVTVQTRTAHSCTMNPSCVRLNAGNVCFAQIFTERVLTVF